MKSTRSFAAAAIAVGALAGAAVGYWEARPWTVIAIQETATSAEPAHNHDHGHDHAAGIATDDNVPSQPKAVIGETTFKFGNMESGATQRHTFPLRNEGSGPLTIKYVAHTCKCTEVRLNDKLVEPGAVIVVPPKSELAIMLEWAAKVPPGPFRHGASFTTNDAEVSRLEITVEGEIVEIATLEPSQLVFGSVHVGQPAKAELVVMAFLEPEVEILSHEVLDQALAKLVTVSVEPLQVDQLPNPKAKAGVKVVASYDSDGTLGPFVGSLRLETNLAQSPRLEVPLSGTVKGDISIFGNLWNEANGLLRMAPATTSAGGASRLNIHIRGQHAADTEISVASVEPEELKVTLGKRAVIRDGLVRVPLEVAIAPGTRPMARAGEDQGGEGEIILATTHPETPKVRLRVYFTVQP